MNNSDFTPLSNSGIICLSVRSGSETRLVRHFECEFGLTALYASRLQEELHEGSWITRTKPLITGYIFIYNAVLDSIPAMRQDKDVHRILTYSDGDPYLHGADLEFARWLQKQNGCMGVSQAVTENEQVIFVAGPLKDYDGRILKLDKHRRCAQVEIPIADTIKKIWLSFQWLGKSKTS